MFYAGTRDLNISSTLQKNISVGVFGGEGLFQTQVKGSGVVVLYSPVLANEVQKIELDNELAYIQQKIDLFNEGFHK